MNAVVVKRHGRMWIIGDADTSELLYTPPDFIRHKLHGRNSLQWLADRFNERQKRCTDSIIKFEATWLLK